MLKLKGYYNDKVSHRGNSQVNCKSNSKVTERQEILQLPVEIWRIIFNFLNPFDLCRCVCVCKQWNSIIYSLDITTWRRLFLSSHEWRHPHWPCEESEPTKPWRILYRENYLISKMWCQKSMQSVSCLHVFKRRRERKVINVGPGFEHETFRSALNVACEYDRILLHPGVYDEQFEMSSKLPLELVGCGPLGSVTIVVCIEQNALTGRLCNLVLRAPWFTGHMLKISLGHLQVDNCRFEDGQILVQNPGSCLIRYTEFVRAHLALHHVSVSVIENCYFSTDNTAIQVRFLLTCTISMPYIIEIDRYKVHPKNIMVIGHITI